MRTRMLTALAASALCLAAFSPAEAGKRHGSHGDGHQHNGHHEGGHHGGGHHGGGHHGHDHHSSKDRDKSRGCDDHWDSNIGLGTTVRNRNCGISGLRVTIFGYPGGYGYAYGPGYPVGLGMGPEWISACEARHGRMHRKCRVPY